jgi:hypothetical protein
MPVVFCARSSICFHPARARARGIVKRRSQSAIIKPSAFIRSTQLPGAETPGAAAPGTHYALGRSRAGMADAAL